MSLWRGLSRTASSSGASFYARERRATGDELQGIMGRVQTAGEAPSRSLSPSRLPLRAHVHRERRLGARQYQGCLTAKFEGCDIHRNFPKIQYFLDLISALAFMAFLIDIFPYCFATQKSTNNNNNNNNNKSGRSFLVFRNGLNCWVWTVKKIVSIFGQTFRTISACENNSGT